MIFFQTSQSLTDEDLNKIENDFKFELPKEFKDHYLKYNGGYPEKDAFIWNTGERTTLNTFFSIKYPGFISLESTYQSLVLDEKILPGSIIPFATDDGGNFFCISAKETTYGSIYYYNHEHYNEQNKEEALTLINKSFNEFLNALDK